MNIWEKAYKGSLDADALAMPVHWYYDRQALRREYGTVDHYMAPRSPHSGSILYRSKYKPRNARGDILGDQAQYWGKPGIHYHQFLQAGENTLNFKLAQLLYKDVTAHQSYDPDRWLELYVEFMLNPAGHRDTYVEEYHRAFFSNYARGKKPRECGIVDEHIGGLATVPALAAALADRPLEELLETVRLHVSLTHRHDGVLHAADTLIRMLAQVASGVELPKAIMTEMGGKHTKLQSLLGEDDLWVIGQHYSPACYIDDAFPAALYLALKYHDNYAAGLTANAMAGGDNCHRGAVVGALLGATKG
ncbi:MAG: ADP-ribosylglycohydrolase family protein [Verrucomicrobiales bacterium]